MKKLTKLEKQRRELRRLTYHIKKKREFLKKVEDQFEEVTEGIQVIQRQIRYLSGSLLIYSNRFAELRKGLQKQNE